MKGTNILVQSLLVAVGAFAVLVPPAQGTGPNWVPVPGYSNGYYDPDTARRSIGGEGHHTQGLPQSEGSSPWTTSTQPPPPRPRPDPRRQDWRNYPEQWRTNPYQEGWDPWYVRERQRQQQQQQHGRRRTLDELMRQSSEQ